MIESPGTAELFTAGRGYRAVRIPAIAAPGPDRLVVVAVGRRRISDWGPSDLLIRRSDDGGRTWASTERLVRGWGRTVDNPTLVVDRTGALHLLYQVGYRRLLHRRSTDGGRTFTPPTDLTAVLTSLPEREGFVPRRFAPGPGSGALLPSGRLVIPVWASSAHGRRHRPSATLTIVSDDDGMTWSAGSYAALPGGPVRNPSEAAITTLPDGGALLGIRQKGARRRVFARSADGATWSEPWFAPELFEPVCHAALATSDGVVFFANPDSRDSARPRLRDGKAVRENLTLVRSADGGATWGDAVVVDPGPAGYAALAAADGDLHLVYERGELPRAALWPTAIAYRRIPLGPGPGR